MWGTFTNDGLLVSLQSLAASAVTLALGGPRSRARDPMSRMSERPPIPEAAGEEDHIWLNEMIRAVGGGRASSSNDPLSILRH